MATAERRRAGPFAAAIAVATVLAPALGAQVPTVRATVADAPHRRALPGLDWLCSRHLPARVEWPADRDATRAFAFELGPAGLVVLGDGPPLPDGTIALGSCQLGGTELLFACRSDGTEDWWLARDAAVPAHWLSLLRELRADELEQPRVLDAAVLIGHLAGALAEGDPRADLLRLGASTCGTVTWTAWTTPSHLRVRSAGDGGLLLPAALVWYAQQGGSAPRPTALRGFAARDGDRAEAARQSVRSPGAGTERNLSALLHADDQVAFAAVDALRRLGAASALPQIVGAAGPEAPWTSLAAADALRELWPKADPATRQATRAAVQRSRSLTVRAVDVDALGGVVSPVPAERAAESIALRVRALVVLALLATGLYGLWARERARLRVAA